MLQRISNSWIFSFDGKASLKKNKNLDKGENHSQILQSSTWSQKSQLYLCEMQLPETHMKPVVLDKCISFQFSHWHLCDWQKSFLAYEQDDRVRTPVFTFHWRNAQIRTGHRFRQWIPTVTLRDVGQIELDLHLQVNWCNRNRSTSSPWCPHYTDN